VILGAGVVGVQIARQLINEGKDVVLIDRNPERAKFVSTHLDCMVINDEGIKTRVLKSAGIEQADCFISVTNSDEINMISCSIVSSEFGVPLKIARVRNIDYTASTVFSKAIPGIDYMVNSEIETARLIANTVALGADSDVMLFENSDFHMRNIVIDRHSYFRNRTIKDIRKHLVEKFIIPGILREGSFIIPSGDTIIAESDNVYILASVKTMTNIFAEAGKKSEKIDRILIAGGGNIGTLVCRYLMRTGRKITLMETDYDRCKKLSERFPDALIINSDISDESIFEEEGLDRYDLVITATGNQELNILASVYAKSRGIKRAVAVVEKSNYISIASQLRIDSTISPKNSTVDAILKFLRRGDIKSVHSLFDRKVGVAEVIEFNAGHNEKIVGKKIKDIHLPENSLILLISRGDESIIPSGDSVIEEGDTVLIIVSKASIEKIDGLFSRE
jgi:trk system potassium uptake protein TrkA